MKYNQPTTAIVCLGVQQMVMETVSSPDSVIGGYDPSTSVDPAIAG